MANEISFSPPFTPDESAASIRVADQAGLFCEDLRSRISGLKHPKTPTLVQLQKAPSPVKKILNSLRFRFEAHSERHPGVRWEDFNKILWNHPGILTALRKMEETGGEPDVFGVADDSLLFTDFSRESPMGRRNLTLAQAEAISWDLGAELMDADQYRRFQAMGTFDLHSNTILKTPAHIRADGLVTLGHHFNKDHSGNEDPIFYDENHHPNDREGVRFVLRVPLKR